VNLRGHALRHAAFALDPEVVFLNHGSFGATPLRVLDAADAWRRRLERQPVHFMERELPRRLDEAADRVATLVGAKAGHLALIDNATSAVNTVLRGLRLEPGDEILTTGHVYPAVRHAIHHVAERAGADVVVARVPFPLHDADQVTQAVRCALSPRTRLVVVDHITSATGLVYPIAAVVAACRLAGVPVLVDGAHAPVQVALDLSALQPDWYTGNLHKWAFAPKGCAFLYAREPSRVHALTISHGYQQGMREELHWTGTRDPSPWCAIPEALDFLDELGGPAVVRAHNDALCATAASLLAEAIGAPVPSSPSLRASLCTLPLPGEHPPTVEGARAAHDRLVAQGVEVPVFPFAGRCWLRISAQVYNELPDYQRLADLLVTMRR
jgi:isopenicillin-N epimerase